MTVHEVDYLVNRHFLEQVLRSVVLALHHIERVPNTLSLCVVHCRWEQRDS